MSASNAKSTQSNEQVKKKRGRPLKNGQSPMDGAARSKEYRGRESAKIREMTEQLRLTVAVLSKVVVATSERGVMHPKVENIIKSNPYTAKCMQYCLTNELSSLPNKAKVLKSVGNIANGLEQIEPQDYIRASS